MSYDLEKGFIGTKIFLALITGQFQWYNWDVKSHIFSKPARIILNQFSRAG